MIFILLFIVIFFLLKRSNYLFRSVVKSKVRLPCWPYELIYKDNKNNKFNKKIICSKILYSKKFNIYGKPDLIYRNKINKSIIIAELKSSVIKIKNKPNFGDLLQVAAYFIIVEENFKKKPKIAYLIYKDRMFIIKNTNELKKKVLNVVKKMRILIGKC
ncbi:MAG: hypothetical protein LBJ93_02935 [Clostridiales bacterium]|jgi:CRISPR-associated exonuclease Cas4|nr:hypothetical protein [Clostridiales bacterium]